MLRKWEEYYNLQEIENIRKQIVTSYTNKLVFLEEPHEYYLDGVKYMCVSDVTHRYKPITSEEMAENCVNKWHRDQDPSYKYYGMTKEQILAEWKIKSDRACSFGTDVHAFGESMFYYMTGQEDKILKECEGKFKNGIPCPTCPQEEAVVKFWDDVPDCVVPVLAETRVFNTQGIQYAGTFDILFYYVKEPNSNANGLILCDYKTNEDLYKNFMGQTLLWPFNDYLDQNVSYYTLQQSLYAIPLQNLGLKVLGSRLIWLKNNGTYEKISIDDVSDRLRNTLNIPLTEK